MKLKVSAQLAIQNENFDSWGTRLQKISTTRFYRKNFTTQFLEFDWNILFTIIWRNLLFLTRPRPLAFFRFWSWHWSNFSANWDRVVVIKFSYFFPQNFIIFGVAMRFQDGKKSKKYFQTILDKTLGSTFTCWYSFLLQQIKRAENKSTSCVTSTQTT